MNKNNMPQLIDAGYGYDQSGLVHRVQVPNTAGPHPTVIMLQGRAGTEDVMWVFARTLPSNWLFVAPRALYPEDGGYSWHPPISYGWATLSEFDEAVARINHFITTLPTLYNADPDQIYLMGFSQGAALSLAVAMDNPGQFQGLAGLVGFMPEQSEKLIASAPLMHLPVFWAAGTKDERIPIEISQRAATAVRAAGAFLEYREYDTGHKLNGAGMRKLSSWWAERDKMRHTFI